MKHIVISGTNYWNPGDDFVRDGVIRVLHGLFPGTPLNFLFYNFNPEFHPQDKFAGIGNFVSKGDLDQYRDSIDHIVIAGLSAGDEIKDLYRWIISNGLEDRVFLIGAGYENNYVAGHVLQEPEATIFRKARIVIGRTEKTPAFVRQTGVRYVHLNCPAILSVPEVKSVPPGKRIERIGFSIQLPHEIGIVNQACAATHYELAVAILRDLSRSYEVEVVAHHKSEYFHFLRLLRHARIPVIFSSFYQDLHGIYPRYDLVITTRLHASLFANGHGIPGIIINDTDRHTHTLKGFPHSAIAGTSESFVAGFSAARQADLSDLASEASVFKQCLLGRYLEELSVPFGQAPRKTGKARSDKLNIGCGSDYREGFHNVDGNAQLPRVDEVLDIKPGILPKVYGPKQFSHLLAKDFLEHHHHWEAIQLLRDFHAVLREGGNVELFLPNIEAILNDRNKTVDEKKLWLYGGQDTTQPWETPSPTLPRKHYPQYFCHRYGWTPAELTAELQQTGFDNVRIDPAGDGWNMHVHATRPADYAFDSEKKEQLLVRSRFRPGMVALDVGANIGKYTKLFSLLTGGEGKVFAFEPDPGSVRRLRDLVARDGLENVTIINAAVSDAAGQAILNQFPTEYSSWNSLGRPQMEDPRNPSAFVPIVGSVEVETVTLDEYCQAQGHRTNRLSQAGCGRRRASRFGGSPATADEKGHPQSPIRSLAENARGSRHLRASGVRAARVVRL